MNAIKGMRSFAFVSGMLAVSFLALTGCGYKASQSIPTSNQTGHKLATESHGATPSFRGTDVQRFVGSKAISALPTGYDITEMKMKYTPGNFVILDSWSGMLDGHRFVLTIYRHKADRAIVVANSYDGKVKQAFMPTYSGLLIRNFTGSMVVCEYSPAGWFALNLQNGTLVQGQAAAKLSGFYPKMKGPDYVLGLPKRYPVSV